MRNLIPKAVMAVMLSGVTTFAGSFTNSLANPNQTTGLNITGTGTLADGSSWTPIVANGALMLTTNAGSLGANVILDDLDGGQPIESFKATFKLQLGPGSSPPADGMAFAFGPDISAGSNFGEEGPGGAGDLVVEFDTYLNTGQTPPDNIGIDVKVSGVEVATTTMANTDLVDSTMHDVSIQLNRNGTLNLAWKGQVIYTNLDLAGWAPINGQFGFGARTGGSSEECDIANLSITTTLAGAATAPTITGQPQSQTINEFSNVTFTVSYDGTPPFTFQWAKNGTAITDATNNFLTVTGVAAADTGAKFKCTVTSSLGTVTSQEATLTVKSDTTPPALVSVTASNDLKHVTVVFSKPVTQASAEVTANYQIAGLTISAASLSSSDNATVVLTTSSQAENTGYTLTVNNIKDTSTAGNTIAANTTKAFTSAVIYIVAAGALVETNGTTFDVGVTFSGPIDPASATTVANYTLSAGTISGATYFAGSPGVVLKTAGLTVGNSYTVTVNNLTDLAGNKVPSTNQQFTVSKMAWGEVGGDELGLGPGAGYGVVAVGTNGFDVYSDGSGEWASYDEATFVHEKITGDFDKKVRVEYQDTSSQWARAGLIVREVTNFGVDRATQEGGAAGRYQKCHVNPVFCLPSAAGATTNGNNSWEGNRRLDVGGATTSALTGANSTPKYPNAWCRIQRQGQTFTIYRSDDGATWVNLGSTTWPDANDPNGPTPMADTVYVGPEYSPENGNIYEETPGTLRGRWLAKFRNYGDTFAPVSTVPTLSVARAANGITLTFTGTLQSADTVSGPWTDMNGVSPQTVTTTGSMKFYRAKK
jgi:hypothetical protein